MNDRARGRSRPGLHCKIRDVGEALVICPNCGEENSSDFRFCGMCGTPLESQPLAPSPMVAAAAQVPTRVAETRRSEPRHAPVLNNVPPLAAKPQAPRAVATIAGPSLLGLGQVSEAPPDIDTLRQKSFSGVNSFLEPEEHTSGGRRVFLLLVLLLALGTAGWWTYSNYVGATRTATSHPAAAPATSATPAVKPEASTTPPVPPAANSSRPEAPPASPHQETASVQPKPSNPPPAAQPSAKQNPPAATPKPVLQVSAARAKTQAAEAPAPAAPKPATAVVEGGDADYRKGEAYLYGRGVGENCDEAVKFLKAASAKQSAKARSTFGTMYATGHCVPRDLPTSYAWFALALHLDPNNQILEKDLTAIWNQMTPPERETATKSKQ